MKITYKNKILKENIEEVDSEGDILYKQSILKAIASETEAYNIYDNVLLLEKEASEKLVNTFHKTILDIRDEEMKHLGQLMEKLNEVPNMKDALIAGTEEAETGKETEIKESVELKETVSGKLKVQGQSDKTIEKEWVLNSFVEVFSLDDNDIDALEKLIEAYDEVLGPTEVDILLREIQQNPEWTFTDEYLQLIENNIADQVYINHPELDTEENYRYDVNTLVEIKDGLFSEKAKKLIDDVINTLQNEIYKANID